MNGPASAVLALNAGASSLKFALYPHHGSVAGRACLSGLVAGLQPGGHPVLRLRGDDGGRGDAGVAQPWPAADGDPLERALAALGEALARHPVRLRIAAVAHRIVHGGERYARPALLDDAALAYLDSLAPLHQRHHLAGVPACRRAYPQLPQVGCFDTAFHATLPELEQWFALPQALRRAGVRRYGFHGLSCRYVAARLPSAARAPAVRC